MRSKESTRRKVFSKKFSLYKRRFDLSSFYRFSAELFFGGAKFNDVDEFSKLRVEFFFQKKRWGGIKEGQRNCCEVWNGSLRLRQMTRVLKMMLAYFLILMSKFFTPKFSPPKWPISKFFWWSDAKSHSEDLNWMLKKKLDCKRNIEVLCLCSLKWKRNCAKCTGWLLKFEATHNFFVMQS